MLFKRVYSIGIHAMARSQKVVPIKLNQAQIDALDRIVQLGEFNGRSHAMRELLLPALNAGQVAVKSQSKLKAMATWLSEMEKLNHRFDAIAKNSIKNSQGDFEMDLDLPPLAIQPV